MTLNYVLRKIRILPVFFLGLLLSCSNTDLSKQFQSDLESELSDENIGILVSINTLDKRINWCGAIGYSDKNEKTTLRADQTFRIASVTKTFLAATVLRLWEDGRISLDDPISKYISEEHYSILKGGGYAVDSILIRHLLTHSSGMAEHTNSPKYELDFMQTRHAWSRTEQIKDLVTYSNPVGKVGKQFSYSDTGYILLGEIVEKVTGQSMGDAMMEQLNSKGLGLNNTYMENFEGDFTGKRIHQYYQDSDTYNFHPSLDYYGGGGLLSTTSDLSKFYINLFNHKVFHNPSTLDTMLAPVTYATEQSLDYRMGVWQDEIDGKKVYIHSGFWGTQVFYFPEKQLAVAVNYGQRWTNRGNAPIINKILKTLEQYYQEGK